MYSLCQGKNAGPEWAPPAVANCEWIAASRSYSPLCLICFTAAWYRSRSSSVSIRYSLRSALFSGRPLGSEQALEPCWPFPEEKMRRYMNSIRAEARYWGVKADLCKSDSFYRPEDAFFRFIFLLPEESSGLFFQENFLFFRRVVPEMVFLLSGPHPEKDSLIRKLPPNLPEGEASLRGRRKSLWKSAWAWVCGTGGIHGTEVSVRHRVRYRVGEQNATKANATKTKHCEFESNPIWE